MKAGKTIQELLREIDRQQSVKADYLVNTSNLHVDTWNGKPSLHVLDNSGSELVEPLDIHERAHIQIGDYLGIPRKYYERMRTEDADLLAYNINRWFERKPEQRMLRTMDGHARAFLSNRYRRIDNLDIAQITLPLLFDMPEVRYESCNITDDFMYIKAVNPKLTAEVTPGDVVQSGIVISNSETGCGAVYIHPMIYRLVCKNGMTIDEIGTRRNHVGRLAESDENFEIYSKETLKADDTAFIMKIQDSVRAAVDEVKFARVVDVMRKSKDLKLDTRDLPALVKLTGSSLGFTEDESKGVLQRLLEAADYSVYGLANAVTRFSQDVENYDRASKLEQIGYSVLTMSPDLFRAINRVNSLAA